MELCGDGALPRPGRALLARPDRITRKLFLSSRALLRAARLRGEDKPRDLGSWHSCRTVTTPAKHPGPSTILPRAQREEGLLGMTSCC